MTHCLESCLPCVATLTIRAALEKSTCTGKKEAFLKEGTMELLPWLKRLGHFVFYYLHPFMMNVASKELISRNSR